MQLELIVARAANGVIGLNGKMPWHLPEDLKHFKRTTMGAPVVMGRKTWESIGRPLPGRTNVILTRQEDFDAPGVLVFHDLEAALDHLKDVPKVFIIGGAQLYASSLANISKAWVTEIDAAPEGDAFFPRLSEAEWQRTVLEELPANDTRPKLTFCCYVRK